MSPAQSHTLLIQCINHISSLGVEYDGGPTLIHHVLNFHGGPTPIKVWEK